MARAPRHLVDGGLYRIWAMGVSARVLFQDAEDYAVYLKALRYAKRTSRLRLYHYSLLQNEVHLIVEVPRANALSSTLQQTHLTFHWHHRRKYGTTGRLWHDRFRHKVIAVKDLLRIGYHVERIPVRADLTAHPADYPYSSYAHYALGQPNPFLDPSPQYAALAPTSFRRQEQYRQLGERLYEQHPARNS